MGIPYQVCISPELSELLKPNKFLTELGIQYSERIKSVLNVLKGNFIPGHEGIEEAMSKEAVVFPLALVKGPFIKEELISIKAELTDDCGKAGIRLTAILEEE
jgi:translation elongation factor EF-G